MRLIHSGPAERTSRSIRCPLILTYINSAQSFISLEEKQILRLSTSYRKVNVYQLNVCLKLIVNNLYHFINTKFNQVFSFLLNLTLTANSFSNIVKSR